MRNIYTLLAVQFLSAFADNAILFAIFAMLNQGADLEWYRPALQGAFLIPFVVLAPWVGRFADRQVKGRVLIVGNAIKALGTILLFAGTEPLIAYATVGIGAAVYGPAKYGLLPELAGHDRLVKANGLIEGSTIVAIILGAVIGAHVADESVNNALALVIGAYLLSLVGTLLLPKTGIERAHEKMPVFRSFIVMNRTFFVTSRARFSMLGAAVFWAAASVLRVMMVAWAPAVLMTTTTSEIADLTVFIAIGIAAGALVVPWFIPLERLRRARVAAYLMGFAIMLLGIVDDPLSARSMLFVVGLMGGIFVVPINAALQEIGHRSIGTGGAVATQNFFENVGMLIGTLIYTVALKKGLDPVLAMEFLGVIVVIATAVISWHLPRDPEVALALEPERSEKAP